MTIKYLLNRSPEAKEYNLKVMNKIGQLSAQVCNSPAPTSPHVNDTAVMQYGREMQTLIERHVKTVKVATVYSNGLKSFRYFDESGLIVAEHTNTDPEYGLQIVGAINLEEVTQEYNVTYSWNNGFDDKSVTVEITAHDLTDAQEKADLYYKNDLVQDDQFIHNNQIFIADYQSKFALAEKKGKTKGPEMGKWKNIPKGTLTGAASLEEYSQDWQLEEVDEIKQQAEQIKKYEARKRESNDKK